jgi:hypothetical protein
MIRLLKTLTVAAAVLAVPAFAQSVEVKAGPNGQLSGRADAGGISSSVSTANGQARSGYERNRGGIRYTAPCMPGSRSRSRSIRVVSPDGSSSSSSSVSVSGGGTVSAAGGGSPGSRVYEEGCPDDRASTPVRAYRTQPLHAYHSETKAEWRRSRMASWAAHHRRRAHHRAHRR